jgi:hypothetical protein
MRAPEEYIRAGARAASNDFDFTAEVTIEAAAADRPGPRRFDMVAYTGGLLHLPNFEYPVVANLQGMGGTDKARPILKDHNRAMLVGHTDKIVNDGRQLQATGVVSGGGPAAKEVLTPRTTSSRGRRRSAPRSSNVNSSPPGGRSRSTASSSAGR